MDRRRKNNTQSGVALEQRHRKVVAPPFLEFCSTSLEMTSTFESSCWLETERLD